MHNVKKNTEALEVASKETGLEAYANKTKYLVMSRVQNVRRSHRIKTDNYSYKNVLQFKYLGRTVTIEIPFKKKLRAD